MCPASRQNLDPTPTVAASLADPQDHSPAYVRLTPSRSTADLAGRCRTCCAVSPWRPSLDSSRQIGHAVQIRHAVGQLLGIRH